MEIFQTIWTALTTENELLSAYLNEIEVDENEGKAYQASTGEKPKEINNVSINISLNETIEEIEKSFIIKTIIKGTQMMRWILFFLLPLPLLRAFLQAHVYPYRRRLSLQAFRIIHINICLVLIALCCHLNMKDCRIPCWMRYI